MEKKRSEFEHVILKRVSFVLWSIIVIVVLAAIVMKNSHGGSFAEALMAATSVITQIYISDPKIGSVIFLLAFIGKVLIIYIIYVLILLFNEGIFKKSLEEGRIMKKIDSLKDHYIICGGGRVGGRVAEDLMKEKKQFIIIDRNADVVAAYTKKKMLAIDADSLDDSSLRQAGIGSAKVLISCLDHDGDNILQTIIAKKLNPKLKIVSRASHEKFIASMKNAGADDIIIPELIGGQKIAESAMKL